MASKLSGTSSATSSYVLGNIGQLLSASLLPVLLLLVINVGYVVLGIVSPTGGLEAGDSGISAAGILAAIGWGLLGLYIYCWLIAKICRLYLTGEPASLVGSSGTLRAGFRITIYYIAIALITFIPLILLFLVITFVQVGMTMSDPTAMNPIGMIAVVLLAIMGMLLFGWAQCRFVVGFPPLALDGRVGLFDGWRLSKGSSLGLFGRAVAITLLWVVVMLVFLGIFVFVVLPLLGGDLTTLSGNDTQLMVYALVVQQALMTILIVPYYWYLVVMFCEAYRRLSAE